MREIKFRAWDKDTKYMHICGEDIHDEIDFEHESNRAYYYNLQNGCGSLNENSSYTLMQYTGLHDKNGKEIYEGDIVKYKDSTGLHTEIVKYDKGCFFAGMHSGSSTRTSPKLINIKITEVIGNIYDNPELLEEGENDASNNR